MAVAQSPARARTMRWVCRLASWPPASQALHPNALRGPLEMRFAQRGRRIGTVMEGEPRLHLQARGRRVDITKVHAHDDG